jgi:hypothetical protein
MASAKKRAAPHRTAADSTEAVDDFMRTLEHPFKREIEAVRRLILGAHPAIAEGIKWNALSFRTSEYFATTNLREKKGVGIILHLGAKARELPAGGVLIEDPEKLLKWLGKDRAMVVFENLQEIELKRAAFERIIQHWLAYVAPTGLGKAL